MKNILNKINFFVISKVNVITLSLIVIGLFAWVFGFVNDFQDWTLIQQTFYLMLFFFSISILVGIKSTPTNILLVLFLSVFPLSKKVLELMSDWFFYESPFTNHLQNIAAKDLNVFIAFL